MGNTNCRRCRRSDKNDCFTPDEEMNFKTTQNNNNDAQDSKKTNQTKLIKKSSFDEYSQKELVEIANFDIEKTMKVGMDCCIHQFYDKVIEKRIDPKKAASIVDSIKRLIEKEVANDDNNEEECQNQNDKEEKERKPFFNEKPKYAQNANQLLPSNINDVHLSYIFIKKK